MNGLHGLLPPNGDRRGFVHKRIGRAVVGGVTGFVRGGVTGAVGGAASGFVGGGVPAATVCPPGFDLSASGGCAPRSVTIRAPAFRRFRQQTFRQPSAVDVTPVPGVIGFVQRVIPGGETGLEVLPSDGGDPGAVGPAAAPGVAVVGRFGAGIEPMVRVSQVRDCQRGMVLAVDGLCYNRRDLRNSERFWPRGRRPLLTGGDMRAISTAASAARKLQRKQKDLMKLGLLPKPTARRRAPTAADIHHAKSDHR